MISAVVRKQVSHPEETNTKEKGKARAQKEVQHEEQLTAYVLYMQSEWCGCMKMSSVPWPKRAGMKHFLATWKKGAMATQYLPCEEAL